MLADRNAYSKKNPLKYIVHIYDLFFFSHVNKTMCEEFFVVSCVGFFLNYLCFK